MRGGHKGHTSTLLEMWVDDDTRQLFSGGKDGAVCVWKLDPPEPQADAGGTVAPNWDVEAGKGEAKSDDSGGKTVHYGGVAIRASDGHQIAVYTGTLTYMTDGSFNGQYKRYNGPGTKLEQYVVGLCAVFSGSGLTMSCRCVAYSVVATHRETEIAGTWPCASHPPSLPPPPLSRRNGDAHTYAPRRNVGAGDGQVGHQQWVVEGDDGPDNVCTGAHQR